MARRWLCERGAHYDVSPFFLALNSRSSNCQETKDGLFFHCSKHHCDAIILSHSCSYRQSDAHLIKCLGKLRLGDVDEEVCRHFGVTLARELQPSQGLVPTLLTCKNEQAVRRKTQLQQRRRFIRKARVTNTLASLRRATHPSSQDAENERRLLGLGQVLQYNS